ncbi:MAG: hypothetical protein LBT89_02735 [Planctomycetaceae bacterium]|nr:hypothetical protein [Planctomycetaceae bacterium]
MRWLRCETDSGENRRRTVFAFNRRCRLVLKMTDLPIPCLIQRSVIVSGITGKQCLPDF